MGTSTETCILHGAGVLMVVVVGGAWVNHNRWSSAAGWHSRLNALQVSGVFCGALRHSGLRGCGRFCMRKVEVKCSVALGCGVLGVWGRGGGNEGMWRT